MNDWMNELINELMIGWMNVKKLLNLKTNKF